MTLHPTALNFLIYEKNFLFFLSVYQMILIEEFIVEGRASLKIYSWMCSVAFLQFNTPLPHPPPRTKFLYTVCGGRRRVVRLCWRLFYCRIFTLYSTVYVTRFGIYKITCPPQDKNWEGRGINKCRTVLFQVTFRRRDFELPSRSFIRPRKKVFSFSQTSIRGKAYFIWQS
jgi:hypothetical protein